MHRTGKLFPSFVLLLALLVAIPASAEWFATLKLPYDSPGYLEQWEKDPQQVLFTLNNHSAAPAPIVFELIVQTENTGELFRGTCVPFMMVNNAPRAFRTEECIRWKDIVWNPAHRGTFANSQRIPEGEVNVCVRVFEWKGTRGTQLAEACAKTNVVYPDVPQPTTPRDDAHVNGSQVAFSWSVPAMPSEINLEYRFELAEISAGQKPEDVLAHPLAAKTVQSATTSLSWGAPLKLGATYCWRVTALDQYGLPATAHDGFSRVVRFHFDALDDREIYRELGRWKKEIVAISAPLKSDPAAAPLLAPVEAALNGEPSAKIFTESTQRLTNAVDSLTATASPATMETLCAALALSQRSLRAAGSSGVGPYDSVLTTCLARAMAMKKNSSPAIAANVDSLNLVINSSRSIATKLEMLPKALALHQRALALEAAGAAENSVWHDRLHSLLNATAALVHSIWPAGGIMLQAELLSKQLQTVASKKNSDQAAALHQLLGDAQAKAIAFTASSTAVATDAALYDVLHRIMIAEDNLKSQWKGSADGTRLIESIHSAVDTCTGLIVRERESNIAELFFILVRAQLAAAKKSSSEFDNVIASCAATFAQPNNGVLHAHTITDVLRAVREHLAKGDKSWGMIPIAWLNSISSEAALASSIADLHDALATAASVAKDAEVKKAATRLAAYCNDVVNRCSLSEASSSLAHDLGTPQIQRRMASDLVRDIRSLARMANGAINDACVLMENNIVHAVLEHVYLQTADLAELRGTLQQRGLMCMFGTTANNAFVEIQGNVLMINQQLADQNVNSVVPYIIAALRLPPANSTSAQFETMLAERDALKKSKGEGWNARSDFFLDAGVLGEQEISRMLRASSK